MSTVAERATADPSPTRSGWLLLGGGVLLLTVGGVLLWVRHGAAVFGHYVTSALAWCF